mmetsp:Transcript_84694/g.234857  ORF Transcript_84694/g.234857 Transcript_84694/m.234857 type:complete len:238 (+) Transcript_84694:546-1259(+)
MEDAGLEAQGHDAVHRELLERHLLLLGQQRRADGPGLVEVRLQGRAIVCDRRVLPLAARHDHVDIHLAAVEVLLAEHRHVDDRRGVHTAHGARVTLDERTARDDERRELGHNLAVAAQHLLTRADFLHPQRCRARDWLQYSRKSNDLAHHINVRLRLDEAIPWRGQARGLQRCAGGVLVPRGVHGVWPVAGQPQGLAEPGHQRHRELHEGCDAVHRPRLPVPAELLDEAQHGFENLI